MSQIEYGKVRLRPWKPDDVKSLIEIAECAHVQHWLRDWEDVQEWAEPWIAGQALHHQKAMPMEEFMSWAITVPPSDRPIGVINFGGDEMDHQGVSLGYFLHEDALHRGYATQAVCALSRYVFERWPFEEIHASVDVENHASKAVMERSGFALYDTRLTELSGNDHEVPCAWYKLVRNSESTSL